MKNIMSLSLKWLKSNMYLKIAAVVFALIVWVYVMAETNPPREKTVHDVGVQIENVALLKDKGFVVTDNIDEMIGGAGVVIQAKQLELQYINADNVSAVVDLSEVNSHGEVVVKVGAVTKYGKVLSVSPSRITVNVDDYISKNVPVEIISSGQHAQGYYYGTPQTTPELITLSGARSVVEQAAKAVYHFDSTGITSSVNQSVNLAVLSEGGEQLDITGFTNLPAAILKVPVFPQKSVPVNPRSAIIGMENLKSGYEFLGLTVRPENVFVAGDSAKLGAITEVLTEPLDISGLKEDTTFSLPLKGISGVIVTYSNYVRVTVHIGQKQSEKTFKNVPVEVRNLPEGKRGVAERTDVTASGGISALNDLNEDKVKAFVTYSPGGDGTFAVEFESVDGVSLKCAPERVKVSIR